MPSSFMASFLSLLSGSQMDGTSPVNTLKSSLTFSVLYYYSWVAPNKPLQL